MAYCNCAYTPPEAMPCLHCRARELRGEKCPPGPVVEEALAVARQSPCAKSHRGVVIYEDLPLTHVIYAVAYNGPPRGVACTGREIVSLGGGTMKACADKDVCRDVAVHAEVRAIRYAVGNHAPMQRCHLVHVKADLATGELVAGGGPSCEQCSREILDARVQAVWLYRTRIGGPTPDRQGEPYWHRYDRREFHEETLRACNLPLRWAP